MKKPRAKNEGEEVPLQTYSALQSFDLYCDRVMKQMLAGCSTRNYEPLLDEISGSAGLKKSTVSKAFKRGSLQALEMLNSRDLSGHESVTVLIDGIEFQKRHIIVALGITTKGEKPACKVGSSRPRSDRDAALPEPTNEFSNRILLEQKEKVAVLAGWLASSDGKSTCYI